MLFSFKDLFTTREEGITFLLVGGISALLLDLSILFLVLQGNQKRYYEQKALENEYYLQAELRYFQARQKDQEAVRRLRHDMKNHLFCIQDLLSRGEKQELAAYLEELNTRLSKNAGDISLGQWHQPVRTLKRTGSFLSKKRKIHPWLIFLFLNLRFYTTVIIPVLLRIH